MTVLELLSDPVRWTQEAYARNVNGMPVNSRDYRATCWCLTGAVCLVYPGHEDMKVAFSRLHAEIPPGVSIIVFNDSRSHAEVLDLVRKAGI